ncbi:hypothetical protein BH24GEM1_BH24GEM1_13200 [soil metagenome]
MHNGEYVAYDSEGRAVEPTTAVLGSEAPIRLVLRYPGCVTLTRLGGPYFRSK